MLVQIKKNGNAIRFIDFRPLRQDANNVIWTSVVDSSSTSTDNHL
jgi:hypothetical protein